MITVKRSDLLAEQDAAVRKDIPSYADEVFGIQVSITGVNHDSDNIQINQLLAAITDWQAMIFFCSLRLYHFPLNTKAREVRHVNSNTQNYT